MRTAVLVRGVRLLPRLLARCVTLLPLVRRRSREHLRQRELVVDHHAARRLGASIFVRERRHVVVERERRLQHCRRLLFGQRVRHLHAHGRHPRVRPLQYRIAPVRAHA